ncbi:MAG: hypothetical protein HYY14_01650 [Candidatus Omnitrophica bacterium]|nr:hypothetical protein [Candidatus Omnitrophota bacterium]
MGSRLLHFFLAWWPLTFPLAFALIRLFIWGPFYRYDDSIRDASRLKKGDIILTGKKGVRGGWYIQLSNVLTRKLKHRFWTHAAICQGNGKVWEAQPEGIIEKDIAEYLEGDFVVRAYRHRYITDETVLDKVLAFCAAQEGCCYGWRGLVFYVFSTIVPISFNLLFDNRLVDRLCRLDGAYFCSELIVDAFQEAGHPISPFDGWRVKPSDFISNPLLQPVE